MKQACVNSGGHPSSVYYNDWVQGNGCVCPGSSSGSGQATCPASAGAGAGAAAAPGPDIVSQFRTLMQQMHDEGVRQEQYRAQIRAESEKENRLQQQLIRGQENQQQEAARRYDEEKSQQRQDTVAQMQMAPANAPAGNGQGPVHTQAYGKGYRDASQCYSQSAGTYCSGISGDAWQKCLDDYRAGYQVGQKLQTQLLDDAEQAGKAAGASGRPADAAADLGTAGSGCNTELTEAYNRGYFQGRHPAP
jgi:hypothetical protein